MAAADEMIMTAVIGGVGKSASRVYGARRLLGITITSSGWIRYSYVAAFCG
jgi:hypothetical protein